MKKGYIGINCGIENNDPLIVIGNYYKADAITNNIITVCVENPIDLILLSNKKYAKTRYFEIESHEQPKQTDQKIDSDRQNFLLFKICREAQLTELLVEGIKYIEKKCENASSNQGTVVDINNWCTGEDSHCKDLYLNTGERSISIRTGSECITANNEQKSIVINDGMSGAAVNAGDNSAAISQGFFNAATNVGEDAVALCVGFECAAVTTGIFSNARTIGETNVALCMNSASEAIVEGEASIAIAAGPESKAKGALGCWIVLAEWEDTDDNIGRIKNVRATKVDGEKIKADTFYRLERNKFIETHHY